MDLLSLVGLLVGVGAILLGQFLEGGTFPRCSMGQLF